MLGFNGGLLGARRETTVISASGLWMPNEQSIARRANVWPKIFGGPQELSPILWYDFSDETTVTEVSSQITSVIDKGSKGWNLTKSTTGPAYVTGINGLKCLDWGSSQHSNYLRNSTVESQAIGEVYYVLDAAFGGAFPSFNGLFTGTGGGAWFFLGFPSTTSILESGTNFNRVFINGGTLNRFSNVFSSPSINNPAILRIKNVDNGTFNTSDGFQIGMDRSNGDRGWYGLVGEVIVFSSALAQDESDLLVGYLAAKWGITLV